MDKKAVMKEVFDGRVELLNRYNDTKSKLYNMNADILCEIRRSLERDIEILKDGEPFWDGLTDERIAAEQELYLSDKAIVNRIAEIVDELSCYIHSLAE